MIEGFAQAIKLPPARKDKLEMVFQYLLVKRGKKDGLKFADMLDIGTFMNNAWDETKCQQLVKQVIKYRVLISPISKTVHGRWMSMATA